MQLRLILLLGTAIFLISSPAMYVLAEGEENAADGAATPEGEPSAEPPAAAEPTAAAEGGAGEPETQPEGEPQPGTAAADETKDYPKDQPAPGAEPEGAPKDEDLTQQQKSDPRNAQQGASNKNGAGALSGLTFPVFFTLTAITKFVI